MLYIMHTRLKHRSSNMNADLFHVNLANDPGCLFMHSDVLRKFHEQTFVSVIIMHDGCCASNI